MTRDNNDRTRWCPPCQAGPHTCGLDPYQLGRRDERAALAERLDARATATPDTATPADLAYRAALRTTARELRSGS